MYANNLNKHSKIGAKQTRNFEQLKSLITQLSVEDNFEDALDEWRETDRYFISNDGEYCICGKKNIHELCIIRNIVTGVTLTVGNCCINHFCETDSRLFFNALRKIDKDITRSANQSLILFAFVNMVFSREEYVFYSEIWRKRSGSLTPEQADRKIQLNQKLLEAFKVEKLPKGRSY